MSVEAITWALKQPVPSSPAKFVLVVLANCASGDTLRAYPSVAYIANATGQDRKTVLLNLDRLRGWGLIEDTGDRAGHTRQIVVYRLRGDDLLTTVPKTERFQKRNGSNFPAKQSQISPETVPNLGHGTVRTVKEPVCVAREAPTPAAACSIALAKAGFRTTSQNPNLIAYAEAGGTPDHLTQCAADPACGGKPAGYVIAFARRELADAARPVAAGPPRDGRPAAPSKSRNAVETLLRGTTHGQLAERHDPSGAGETALPPARRLSAG